MKSPILSADMVHQETFCRKRLVLFLSCVVCNIIWMVWYSTGSHGSGNGVQQGTKKMNSQFSKWSYFSSIPHRSTDWYYKHCFAEVELSSMGIGRLASLVKHWSASSHIDCRKLFNAFDNIYTITQRTSEAMLIPETFLPKFLKFLNNSQNLMQQAEHQTITLIFNEYTRENTIFNPLRAKRPVNNPEKPEREYVDEISEASRKNCDFCSYDKFTAADSFGRMESTFSYTASNAFKYDAWHTLVVPKSHHPLHWTEAQFLDMFDLAIKWINKVHSVDREYVHGVISWDLLPHAGASQVHPHLHISMTTDRYYGVIESWKIAAEHYHQESGGRNYFSDVAHIHSALGLSVHYGTAIAIAHIVPKKDHEIIVMGQKPNTDFFRLLYFVIRAFLDDMEKFCFSSIIAFPKLGKNTAYGDIPVYARIVTRGSAESIRSDVSSLELFAFSNVNIDPFKVIGHIKQSVKRRSRR